MDKNQKARIHSFESFGTVDGPGIRFVIFFQGCHLQCRYCHNRDLWSFGGGSQYSVDYLFEEVLKYRPFFESSGGGLTVSGGDPIMQSPAVTELFRRCKEVGIHTAIDTSGAISITPKVEALLEVTDLVLLDIKQMNNERHKDLTGLSNDETLLFAKHLKEKNIPTWIRYVVVPTVTDYEEDCKALAEFVSTLSNVEKVELLPFHKMGEFKWDSLGLGTKYTLADIQPPSAEDMKRVIGYFSKLNIPVCTATQ